MGFECTIDEAMLPWESPLNRQGEGAWAANAAKCPLADGYLAGVLNKRNKGREAQMLQVVEVPLCFHTTTGLSRKKTGRFQSSRAWLHDNSNVYLLGIQETQPVLWGP